MLLLYFISWLRTCSAYVNQFVDSHHNMRINYECDFVLQSLVESAGLLDVALLCNSNSSCSAGVKVLVE